jgi:segregation and condensation protein A
LPAGAAGPIDTRLGLRYTGFMQTTGAASGFYEDYPQLKISHPYKFRLDDFEGPLDLLLFLIKKNEVNIYDIPICKITEQYLAYLAVANDYSIEDLSSFQVMAATLIYIKSRMLLPVELNLDDEIEDPRRDLVEKLIEYQKFKKLSLLMEEKEMEAEWVLERKKIQRTLPFDTEDVWQQVEVWDLLKTFSTLISRIAPERIIDLYEEVTINEKITLLSELLEERGECAFTDLLVRKDSLLDIVCAFLAILEAVKLRLIRIYQNRMFGDIVLRNRDNEKPFPSEAQTRPIGEDANAGA